MKVKVTQTLELDEVPDLVKEILDDCIRKLGNCSNIKCQSLVRNMDNLQKFGTTLHELREELASVDAKLLDCWNISLGYDRAINDPVQPTEDLVDE
jgi:hypothetical protein